MSDLATARRELIVEQSKSVPRAGTAAARLRQQRIDALQLRVAAAKASQAFRRRWAALGRPQFWLPG